MEHKLAEYDIGETLEVDHLPGTLTVVGHEDSRLIVEGEPHAYDCGLYYLVPKSSVEDEWDAHETLVMPIYRAEAEEKGYL